MAGAFQALIVLAGLALSRLFAPPQMPSILLLPGTYSTVKAALEMFYYRGFLDGFLLGALTVVVVYPRIQRKAEQ